MENLSYSVSVQCCYCKKFTYKLDKYVRNRLKHKPNANFFCSFSCNNKSRLTNDWSSCSVCGKAFYCSKSQEKYRNRKHCSRKCKAESMKPKYIGSVKSRRGLINKTQDTLQLWARIRDTGIHGRVDCISCGASKTFSEVDGGHFISKKSSAIRFDERNINAQCHKCNRFFGGNARHYLKGMLKKYGQEVVDELESQEFKIKKWTYEELDEILKTYKTKIDESGYSKNRQLNKNLVS